MDSADPPLAVHRLYGGRHRQRRGRGEGEVTAWLGLLAVAPLAVLFFSGLYLFVLPYANRWRSVRRAG